MNVLMNFWVRFNVGTFWSSFSRRTHLHLLSYPNYDEQHGIRSTWKVVKSWCQTSVKIETSVGDQGSLPEVTSTMEE